MVKVLPAAVTRAHAGQKHTAYYSNVRFGTVEPAANGWIIPQALSPRSRARVSRS